MSASIGGVGIGNVQNEGQRKNAGLFTQPIPTSDSDSTILLDLFGTTKNMTIEGIKSGTASGLNTFITAIEGIANGSQTGSTFVSSLSTYANKTVFVKDFGWNYAAGDPSKITYTLELQEGTAVA